MPSNATSANAKIAKRLAAAILAAGLTACTTTPNPIAAGTDTDWRGNLASGEKFGMAVGHSATEAQDMLWAAGFGYEGAIACTSDTRALLGCRDGDAFLKFQPVALDRKGSVYLKIDGGRITAIGWDLKIVPALEG